MNEFLTDDEAVNKAVDMLKDKGIFDQIRKNCLEDINTKSSFLNLNQRIEGYVKKFLNEQEWNLTLNKNQLRERLRKEINESGLIKSGVTHLVDQVINPVSFEGKIEEQIRELLGIEMEFEDEQYQQKQIKNESDQFNDKLSDKLDDISDDEDDDFFEKTNDEPMNESRIKIERNLDDENNSKSSISLDRLKTEKYESSISSTEDLDL